MPMSLYQSLTLAILRQRELTGLERVREALLRRGFLVRAQVDSIELARGSHPGDIAALQKWFRCERLADGGVGLHPRAEHDERALAREIVLIPEHRHGEMAFPVAPDWRHYQAMIWGARVSVGPWQRPRAKFPHNGLDIGVAALVKALPLARVTSVCSCDGHGRRPARIDLWSGWDAAWFEAVHEFVGGGSGAVHWSSRRRQIVITPVTGIHDRAGQRELLEDVFAFAQRLRDPALVEFLGRTRDQVCARFDERGPSPKEFGEAAREQLRR
jgi:hypothetical protein